MDCSTPGSSVLCSLPEFAISFCATPFSFCLQSFYSSESFPMSWFFTSGGQSIGASVSESVLPMSSQGLSPLGWANMISLQSKGFSSVFSRTTIWKQNSAFFMVQLSHLYMTTGKIIALTIQTHVRPMSTICHSFYSKEEVSFNFMASVTFNSDFWASENKICHSFHFPPFYLPWSDGTGSYDLSFLNVAIQISFFQSPLSPLSRKSLVPLHFLPLQLFYLHFWGHWYFSWKS